MNSYFMPTKLVFGRNCIMHNSLSLERLGKKALIVTGKRSAVLSGAQKEITDSLKKLNIDYKIFNEIEENPTLNSIIFGATEFKENGCDFIIGIGGGSPIDAAKAISVIAANNLEGREIYKSELIKKSFPIIAIPTTSGTGTEVTQYSVITDTEHSKKAGFGNALIFPQISFLDPKYTITLPRTITRDTAIDALSHLIEGLYSNRRNSLIYPILFKGVKLILDNLIPCLDDLEDYSYRENLMKASLYGGIVIAQTSTTLQHSIGYPLTTEFGVSHGLANGIVMKHIMEKFSPYIEEEMNELWNYLEITKEEFYEWLDSLDLTIDFEITEAFINEKVEEVMNSRNMLLNPYEVSEQDISEIYRKLI